MTPRSPGFFTHLGLLWGLRLRIGLNRGSGSQRSVAVAAFLFSSAPSVVLAVTFYRLMHVPVVAQSQLWPEFIVRLLCFVTTSVWVAWPVLSAGVDDHSELSRYAAFPISSFRLMTASMLSSLAEPRALVFYGPLVGATVGYVTLHPPAYPLLCVAGFAAFVLFNAALSRVGLHVVLDVLRQKRSAELIGGGFVVTLVAASFIPPVDTSWLSHLTEVGAAAVPDSVIADAALALGRFPTGYFAHGLTMAAHGQFGQALADALGLVELTLLAMVVAWGLLIDFHRKSGRAGAVSTRARSSNPFAKTGATFSTLVVREALDLWNNPRARLLGAVPFVLGILLKLLSGRALFAFFLGRSADAWVLGGLSLYGAIVMGSTFSQNAFAYDGTGFSVFLTSPVPLGQVLRAKNLVHALAGAALAGLVIVFYVTYFRQGSALDVLLAVTAVAALLPVLLTAGNFLSLYFPVKFHANLKRRDKLPFAASMLGVGAAGLGTWTFGWALRLEGRDGPSGLTVVLVAGAAALGWLAYRVTLPIADRLLVARRELVLRAVTRE